MSIPSIGSTPPPPVNGLVVSRYTHQQRPPNESRPAAVPAPTGSSTDNANQLASAIAAALAQLGLTATSAIATATATAAMDARGTGGGAADSGAALASQAKPLQAQPQIQQYKNVASRFSSLAQALEPGSYGTPSAFSGSGNLSAVFQSLWSSLGASSATPANGSADSAPALSSFLQTLAQHFSESGVSGLRGMFVDTVA